ncbi:hypothetical protein [Chloroflexus sp.]|uniref:hypothetical protein n=1 Tax=Chloroflexus sp. TaxID=1904827 RepID=UPI002ADD90EC|nr:hypothetical protein [Chloroflexus sp.]
MYRVTLVLAVFFVSTIISPASPGAASDSDPICFTDHEKCVDSRFADFWRSNDVHANTGKKDNALRIFGYPLGPAWIESVNGEAVLAQPFANGIMQQPLGNTDPAQISLQKTRLERLRQLKQEPSLPHLRQKLNGQVVVSSRRPDLTSVVNLRISGRAMA